MNTLFIVLSIVAAINAQGDGKPDGPPPTMKGCSPAPNGTKLSDCCPGFPKFHSKEMMNKNCDLTCGEERGPSGFCCKVNCSMNTMGVLTNGKFDATKGKQILATMLANNTAWTSALIGSIVDNCVKSAPAIVVEFEAADPSGNGPKCDADTTLNMAIGKCIRRETFFQCPGLSTSTACKALVTFGKSCPMFPFHNGCGDKNVHKSQRHRGKKEKST